MDIQILDEKSPEIKDFFRALDEMFDAIEKAIKQQKPALTGERYMDNGEVCKVLHLAPRTLQEYRDKRVIPYIKLGGKILYRESDVLRMLEENHYGAAN
jgi:hypothetical protein